MLAIKAVDLRKSYGDTKAVDGVTLEVPAGEFFGVLGPNGAGKTTLLELIEGLRHPDDGRVEVFGEEPSRRRPELIRRIGVQFQTSARPAPAPRTSPVARDNGSRSPAPWSTTRSWSSSTSPPRHSTPRRGATSGISCSRSTRRAAPSS